MSAFERSMLRLTQAAITISVITGLIFAGQLYEMWQNGRQTEKLIGAAGTQAEAAGDMANAAGDQVDAADNFADTSEEVNRKISDAVGQLKAAADSANASIKVTQQAIRLDQRAWVAVERISNTPTLELGKEFEIEVTVKNTGKTPAKSAIMIMRWDSFPKGIKPNYSADNGGKEASGIFVSRALIAPNAEYSRKTKPFQPGLDWVDANQSSTAQTKETIKKSFLKRFTDGDMIFYIHGRIDYEDIFHCQHWTTFCSELAFDHEKATTHVCEEHNDADDQTCQIQEGTKSTKRPN